MSLYINTTSIQKQYNSKAKIITPGGIILEFLNNLGILRGDVLAQLRPNTYVL